MISVPKRFWQRQEWLHTQKPGQMWRHCRWHYLCCCIRMAWGLSWHGMRLFVNLSKQDHVIPYRFAETEKMRKCNFHNIYIICVYTGSKWILADLLNQKDLHDWMWWLALQSMVVSIVWCVHHSLVTIYCLLLNWHTLQSHANLVAVNLWRILLLDKQHLWTNTKNASSRWRSPVWETLLFLYFDTSSPETQNIKMK